MTIGGNIDTKFVIEDCQSNFANKLVTTLNNKYFYQTLNYYKKKKSDYHVIQMLFPQLIKKKELKKKKIKTNPPIPQSALVLSYVK